VRRQKSHGKQQSGQGKNNSISLHVVVSSSKLRFERLVLSRFIEFNWLPYFFFFS
jgi:hypothetical protein